MARLKKQEAVYKYKAAVVRVIDGDTIKAVIDLGFNVTILETFRLYGINTPEIRGKTKKKGLESKRQLESKLFKTNNVVILETFIGKKEKYGRWLGIVFLEIEEKQICINDLMISEGLAIKYI
jgi:micrococcal nuclease